MTFSKKWQHFFKTISMFKPIDFFLPIWHLLKIRGLSRVLGGILVLSSFASQASGQNAVPNLDNDIHSNPAAAGYRTRVSFNLVGSTYKGEESYFEEKTYENTMTGSQGSLGLSGNLFKSEIGYSTSKSTLRRTSTGNVVSETYSRTPLFQGASPKGFDI